MKFLITGATGFVGTKISKMLLEAGHEVHGLTRNAERANNTNPRVKWFSWSPTQEIPSKDAFEGVDVVLNLLGENIAAKRWSADQKQKILDSRVKSTQNLIEGLKKYDVKLKSFVSSSAVGIYPTNNGETLMNEETSAANGFLADVCRQWEEATDSLPSDIRKVILRISVVFGNGGGALARLVPIFKLGAGGNIGSGKAWMPWIHIDDLARLFIEAGTNENFNGIYNAVAPELIQNKDFTKALASSLNRPAIFPVPPFMLKQVFGEMSSVILDSQKIESKRLAETGFSFLHGSIQPAMDNLFKNSSPQQIEAT